MLPVKKNYTNILLPLSIMIFLLIVFSVLNTFVMVGIAALLLGAGMLLYICTLISRKYFYIDYSVLSLLLILYILVFHVDTEHLGVLIQFIGPVAFLLFAYMYGNSGFRNVKFIFYAVVAGATVLGLMVAFTGDLSDKMAVKIIGDVTVNANIIAYLFGLGSVVSLYLIVYRPLKHKIFYVLICIFLFALTYLSQSRGALLSMAAAEFVLIYYAYIQRLRYKNFYGILISIAVLGGLSFFVYYSIVKGTSFFADNGRFVLWREAIDVWLTKPLTGTGLYQEYGEHFSSHNLLFDALAQTGIIGFLLILSILFSVLLNTIKEGKGFFIFAFIEAMIDTKQYYIIFIALSLGILAAKVNRLERANRLLKNRSIQ